jgi:uncharacterized protein YpuA (DUF1002 family)
MFSKKFKIFLVILSIIFNFEPLLYSFLTPLYNMALNDLIQNKFSEEDMKKIKEQTSNLERLFADKVIGLNPEDRKKYGSINEQNKLLVNKIKDYVENQPAHNPTEVNWDEFLQDYNAREFLESLIQRLQNLTHQLESTKILHDYDNYQDSLAYYAYIEYRAARNMAGASEIHNTLQQFFPRTGTATKTGE